MPTVFHRCCCHLLAQLLDAREPFIHSCSLLIDLVLTLDVTFQSSTAQTSLFRSFSVPAASSCHPFAQLLDAGERSTYSCSRLIVLLVHSTAAFQCSHPQFLHVCASPAAIKFVYPVLMWKRTTPLETQITPLSENMMDSNESTRKYNSCLQ